MPAYLLAWNPEYEPWKKLVAAHGIGTSSRVNEWRTLNRHIHDGDRVFIVKVGQAPRGLFAAGYAAAPPRFKVTRRDGDGWYVPIRLSKVADPNSPPIPHPDLLSISSAFQWTPRGSGIRIPDGIATSLEAVWSTRVANSEGNAKDDVKAFEAATRNLPKTERDALVKNRIGQGYFRNLLLSYWKSCAVTGMAFEPMLRASHIKPWRLSNNNERLDIYNGLLLTPNLDQAFDTGFISFANDGRILISKRLSNIDQQELGISDSMKLREIADRHRKYLAFHQAHVFDKGTANLLLYTDAREHARVRQ